jgi:outer membrane protein TolC
MDEVQKAEQDLHDAEETARKASHEVDQARHRLKIARARAQADASASPAPTRLVVPDAGN